MRQPLHQRPKFWRKRKTSGYNSPQTHSPKNCKRVPDGAPFLYSIELYRSSPSYRNTKLILLGFRKRCARPIPASSTSLRDASETEGTLPRAKNSHRTVFLTPFRVPHPTNQKRATPNGITRFWYAGRDSQHYGVGVVEPPPGKCPPDICILWFESQIQK